MAFNEANQCGGGSDKATMRACYGLVVIFLLLAESPAFPGDYQIVGVTDLSAQDFGNSIAMMAKRR